MILRRTANSAPLIRRSANPVALVIAARYGGGNNKTYDYSSMFKRELTEEEQVQLAAQKNRTVTHCVPGKGFMAHWIAAEQASWSITFRGIITIAFLFAIMYGSGVVSDNISIYSWVQAFLLVYFVLFAAMHYHNATILAGALGAYVVAYLLW